MITIIAWASFLFLLIFVIFKSITSYLDGQLRLKRRKVFLAIVQIFINKESVHFKRIDDILKKSSLKKEDVKKLYMAVEFLVEDIEFSYKKIDDCYVTNKRSLAENDYNEIQKEVQTGLFDKILDGHIPR
jgi:hypothetical protein